MKRIWLVFLLAFGCTALSYSQNQSAETQRQWTEADRQYLLENLTRTREQLVKETERLSPAQWHFKESPDRWSINQVVEHLAIWELLLQREISMSLNAKPQPELAANARPDSVVLGFLLEEKGHETTDYTKPFTFTVPAGTNEGKNNLAWLLQLRKEGIQHVQMAQEDLRLHYLRPGRNNVHQTYITIFGHTNRHLRQIRKIKQHANFPKDRATARKS